MSNFESDGPSDNEWDDRGELAWNEFDWEKYLREQDDVLQKYVGFYEKSKGRKDRIDHVAHQMGWDQEDWSSDDDELSGAGADKGVFSTTETSASDGGPDGPDYEDSDPYTLHKNPIFIATKAIYLTLKRSWERVATDGDKIPQPVAIHFHTSLYRGEEQSTLAIQALDFGDYAMAISLFKRALRELNQSFALLADRKNEHIRPLTTLRDDIFPKLFDLREIWLRVMNECREELERPSDEDDED